MPFPNPAEFALTREIGGKRQTRPSDREIAGLARHQHGVVSRAQLVAFGLGEDAIDTRLSSGRLHRLHRGVYSMGHGCLPREGWWLAAVLRVGDDAVLSHRSAAELWGLSRPSGSEYAWGRGGLAPVDVCAPRSTRSPPAIRRRFARLAVDETTVRRRIPVTTLARTLFDIARETSVEGLEGAIREAEYKHRFKIERLEDLLNRYPGMRGSRTVKTCLRQLGRSPSGRRRSRLEGRFAALLARTDLPKPTLNVLLDIDGSKVEADCLWSDRRVIVELDGGEAHSTRVAFETDRERDRRLQAAGWRVIRVTWRQLDNPSPLLADLRRLLASPNLPEPAT